MFSGIYRVTFKSSLGISGGGLAVFDNGKINGGDSSYVYRGKYSFDGENITAEILVSHYQGSKNSVFGSLDEFNLSLIGEVSNDTLITIGSIVGQPQVTISIHGKKAADLAA